MNVNNKSKIKGVKLKVKRIKLSSKRYFESDSRRKLVHKPKTIYNRNKERSIPDE